MIDFSISDSSMRFPFKTSHLRLDSSSQLFLNVPLVDREIMNTLKKKTKFGSQFFVELITKRRF